EGVAIERMRPVQCVATLEGRHAVARVEPVRVRARGGVAAGVEAVRRRLALQHADVGRKVAVPGAERERFPWVTRDLSERVNAGVGATRDGKRGGLSTNRREHGLHLPLDRALPVLARPSRETRAVVLDEELRRQPRFRATTNRYSLWIRTEPSSASLNSFMRSWNRRMASSYSSGPSACLMATCGPFFSMLASAASTESNSKGTVRRSI